jgi:hypothetical protein
MRLSITASVLWLVPFLFVSPNAQSRPRDTVSGCYYFFDPTLEGKDDPTNHYGSGQAEVVDYKGRYEVVNWADGAPGAYCLRYTPEKVGDYITFRLRVANAGAGQTYEVNTVYPHFDNEGIYEFSVDGELAGPAHDCFKREPWVHGNWPVKAGEYEITYRYVGKNPQSQGSVLNLIRLEIG